MPQTPINLSSSQPIIEADGTVSQVFRTWSIQVSDSVTIVNAGSPEGVVEAPQYSLYVDEAVPLTPVTYRKMLPQIGGDRKSGWALV